VFKKIFLSLLVLFIIVASVAFFYRYKILQYSAQTLIRKVLPEYISVDRIYFDFKRGEIAFTGFKILNPPGFANKYLLEIGEITCGYKKRGKAVIEGFEVVEPVLKRFTLNIERLGNGSLNLKEMGGVPGKKGAGKPEEKGTAPSGTTGSIKLSKLIKLPEDFLLKDAKVVFADRFGFKEPYLTTFEKIDAKISVKFDDNYSKVLGLSSTGEGNINGYGDEVVRWVIALNPTAQKLTMSNRFEVSGAAITPFEPYYDRYSPFIFRGGRFSGTLIFDFDNGSIGSSNEIRLSGLQFSVKRGFENAGLWETTVPDLVKYFTSSSGEIVFDFKIKGEMSNPKFYLGPISKRALAAMAIDKISEAIQQAAQSKEGPFPENQKSDIQKAKDYIELLKGLVNKK